MLPSTDLDLLREMPIDCANDHPVTPILRDLERDGLIYHIAGDHLAKWRITEKGHQTLEASDYAR